MFQNKLHSRADRFFKLQNVVKKSNSVTLYDSPTVLKGIETTCQVNWEQFRFLGHCPLTPPLNQHFAANEE